MLPKASLIWLKTTSFKKSSFTGHCFVIFNMHCCLAKLVQVEVHRHTHIRYTISLTCGEIGSHIWNILTLTLLLTTNIESILMDLDL